MKRKRGHKKGKSKKLRLTADATTTTSNHDEEMSPNSEDISGSEEGSDDNNPETEAQPEAVSKMETLPGKVEKEVVNVRPEVVAIQRPPTTAVYGRVKLKLKTSKPIVVDSQKQLPPGLGPSDAEKSTQKVVHVDKQVSVEKKEGVLGVKKVEESGNSLPESKKSGVIKIVSGSQQVANVDRQVVSVVKQVVVLDPEEEDSANLLPESKKSGCIKIVSGDKQVSVDKQQRVPAVEKGEDGMNSLLESRKFGGIKIVSGKGLSPPGRKDITPSGLMLEEKEKKVEGEIVNSLPEGKKFGGIKIVSGKGLSPPGRKDSSPSDLILEEKEKTLEGESANSLPESKKFGGIKIVSGKGLSPPGRKDGSPNGLMLEEKKKKFEEESLNLLPQCKKFGGVKIVSGTSLSPPGRKESSPSGGLLEEKGKQEVKVANVSSRYNKKGLEASLEVLKKVMKMDAAEPFNTPVNPVKLGIPDYFDIIDTPMDFGTVLRNLETGAKYMNSKDVYQDVQYIWNNCYKYNNKGDYIVDLMKRVKKNFMKYWVEAGLYTEQTRKQTGGEGTPMNEATTSGHGKKVKRGKGFKLHKDGCMCAICIMKRRRKEREAREAGTQITSPGTEVGKTSLPQEYKQEENSRVESPFGEDTSSYLETSPDDVDAEMEDGEETRLETLQYDDVQKMEENNRVKFHDKSDRSGDVSDRSQRSDKVETESYSHADTKIQDESANGATNYAQGQSLIHPEGQITEHMRQRHELLELEKKRQKLRLLETFRDLENPMLSGLCSTLFPNNSQSVWNGANSLVRSHKAHRKRSGIHDAIASFMTTSYKSSSLK